MCTALTLVTKDHYFGRNLDLEYSNDESVIITPRNFPLPFRCLPEMKTHYAFIGSAIVEEDYPLCYDGTNEYGLSMAGLNFPQNAVYFPVKADKQNVTPFELIPWILGKCKSTTEALELLHKANLTHIPFNEKYPLSPLHWMISDRQSTFTVEQTGDGLRIYENPFGVLTNNPPFLYHTQNVINYMQLSSDDPENRFSQYLDLQPYSRGMGAMGLPGDMSSASRFVRAVFHKFHSVCDGTEEGSVSQFFHILASVAMTEGAVKVGKHLEKTVYSSCCNTDKGVYYYNTYSNSQITAVDMHRVNLEASSLYVYPFLTEGMIQRQN